MITDQDYNQLSDRVYWLDPKHKRYTPSIKEGRIRKFGNLKFQILKIQENSQTDGMQAMAVVSNINIRWRYIGLAINYE